MALPNSGGGYQLGDGNSNEPFLSDQGDITSGLTSAVTLTAAQLATGIISTTPGSALNYTLPLASDVDSLFNNAHVNSSFDFSVINLSGANIGTIATNTGWTLVGTMGVAVSSSSLFRARKLGDATWTLYRIG
ncbi:hypothetical protein UFOVP165_16 [uncultured Caudovirales phage]|uniref:Uncharacterized protein n=1 Tax=uncultured Caudovirales phage TaxID=2100421 RepID=A0A6J7WAU7_9CAUD|nr:hypothetical protein UFOVP72_3 [uncultured Caudovirales phage]CAB5187208.1 hypothetical protein UFOVP165_16 [uncultured Caudovirales phage]